MVTTGDGDPASLGRRLATVPLEELRCAVVLNGGVSLAVWMGGAAHELNRLSYAGPPERDDPPASGTTPYAALLRFARTVVLPDVIAGSSAGGINGAALALAQANSAADLRALRDLWADQGRMESLLRRPFRGQPASLLQGDEYFLPQLNRAMTDLARAPVTPTHRCLDLTITTTLLDGASDTTVDALGQRIPERWHNGHFRFGSRQGDDDRDDFAPENIASTAVALGFAARCSAGFPVAFEPTFVPVDCAGEGGADELRPDMARYASWREADAPADRSRFVVDGGVLANTPTREALEAIDRMPGDGPVRRVMLLVHPHAPGEVPGRADSRAEPPTIAATSAGLLGALSSQGSRNFVREVERHNRRAADRRGGRAEVLATVRAPDSRQSGRTPLDRLYALVDAVWPHYRRLRISRVARDLAELTPRCEGWTVERVRAAVEEAHLGWDRHPRDRSALPYLPKTPPSERALLTGAAAGEGGWAWGITTAVGIADTVAELLRAIVGGADASELDELRVARGTVSRCRDELLAVRETTDRAWRRADLPAGGPEADYWRARLLVAHDRAAGDEGTAIGAAVGAIAAALADVADTVTRVTTDRRRAGDLGRWEPLVSPEAGGAPVGAPVLLMRLLALEVVTATVADDAPRGSAAPVDLVQLSLQVREDFAEVSRTGDDKVAGLSINRFGGFLKRSWRINDWLWGRLDAATVLCAVVLAPARLRRTLQLAGLLANDPAGRVRRAEQLVAHLVAELFGDEPLPADIARLRPRAVAELVPLLGTQVGPADLPGALPALTALVAWALHLEIALEELPALAGAVTADRLDGANARSRGEGFLQQHRDLVEELVRTAPGSPGWVDRGYRALRAVDRAGIGREPLREEAGSDQLIRTAATTGAVAVTLIGSERSGLGGARPVAAVTRALRGLALLPYWVAVGLTRGGSSARLLTLFGLAAGGVLLVLSLFGGVPRWAAGPAALLGLGALLAAFGYGALRSGTVLHGLVLISPIAPLTAYAVSRGIEAGQGDQGSRAQVVGISAVTVLTTLSVLVGLVVLGSLPTPVGSPAALLRRFLDADAARAARMPPPIDPGRPVPGGDARRRVALLRVLVRVAALVAGAALAVAVARRAAERWAALLAAVPDGWVVGGLAVVNVVLVVAGWWLAARAGRRLRLRVRVPVAGARADDPQAPTEVVERAVTHPAGTGATWAVVYGVIYSVASWATGLWLTTVPDPAVWQVVAVVASAAFSAVLLAVVPVVMPRRADEELVRSLRADTAALRRVRGDDPGPRRVDPDRETDRAVAELQRRGDTYSYLVDAAFRLTDEGRDLWRAASADGDRPRPGTPVSVHVLGAALAVGLAPALAARLHGPVGLALAAAALAVLAVSAVFEGRELGRLPVRRRWPGAVPAAASAACVVVLAAGARALVPARLPGWAGTAALLAALVLTALVVVVVVVLRGRATTPTVGMTVRRPAAPEVAPR